jgi:hypothetical protein
LLPAQTEGNCTQTVTSRTSTTLKIKFVCTEPPSSGEGTYQFDGDKAYTARMLIQANRNGRSENISIDSKAQWLSADCGSVKPLSAPQAASK